MRYDSVKRQRMEKNGKSISNFVDWKNIHSVLGLERGQFKVLIWKKLITLRLKIYYENYNFSRNL